MKSHLGPAGAEAEGEGRMALATQLGLDPAGLGLSHDPHGRPLLRCGDRLLAYSLSRAEGRCLQVMALEGRLGVDLVAPQPPETLVLLRESLAPAEQVALGIWPEADRPRRILEAWAAREALLKALGLGLAWGMDLVLGADGDGWLPGCFQGRVLEARLQRIAVLPAVAVVAWMRSDGDRGGAGVR